jgi:hypothetical protein
MQEEMFNILSYKGNANQNNIKILSHLSQNDCHPKNSNRFWQGWGGVRGWRRRNP